MPTPMQRIAKKTKIFSDLKLFQVIYYLYINRYIQTSASDPLNKVMVPIDIDKIAQNIGTDPELVFSRLYVFLNSLYDKPSWNPKIRFFCMKVSIRIELTLVICVQSWPNRKEKTSVINGPFLCQSFRWLYLQLPCFFNIPSNKYFPISYCRENFRLIYALFLS